MSSSLQVAAVVSVVVLAASMVSVAATYGLNAGIIDRAQFSVLVSVVALTTVVPTAIAQRRFTPQAETALQRVGAPTSSADRPHR